MRFMSSFIAGIFLGIWLYYRWLYKKNCKKKLEPEYEMYFLRIDEKTIVCGGKTYLYHDGEGWIEQPDPKEQNLKERIKKELWTLWNGTD